MRMVVEYRKTLKMRKARSRRKARNMLKGLLISDREGRMLSRSTMAMKEKG